MIYLLDSNSFGVLKNYYPTTFPTFWEKIEELATSGRLVSVREVRKEMERRSDSEHLARWVDAHKDLFSGPTEDELRYVAEIFAVPHFQQLIGRKQLLRGTPVADPFIIARARALYGCVVTEEKLKPNAAQVPNVCQHFGVACCDVEGMLSTEEWSF